MSTGGDKDPNGASTVKPHFFRDEKQSSPTEPVVTHDSKRGFSFKQLEELIYVLEILMVLGKLTQTFVSAVCRAVEGSVGPKQRAVLRNKLPDLTGFKWTPFDGEGGKTWTDAKHGIWVPFDTLQEGIDTVESIDREGKSFTSVAELIERITVLKKDSLKKKAKATKPKAKAEEEPSVVAPSPNKKAKVNEYEEAAEVLGEDIDDFIAWMSVGDRVNLSVKGALNIYMFQKVAEAKKSG